MLVVRLSGADRTVRLHAIDAPEAGTREAIAATAKLAHLVRGRRVRLVYDEPTGRIADRYGRLLASVRVDGRDVGEAMLAAGAVSRWQGK